MKIKWAWSLWSLDHSHVSGSLEGQREQGGQTPPLLLAKVCGQDEGRSQEQRVLEDSGSIQQVWENTASTSLVPVPPFTAWLFFFICVFILYAF